MEYQLQKWRRTSDFPVRLIRCNLEYGFPTKLYSSNTLDGIAIFEMDVWIGGRRGTKLEADFRKKGRENVRDCEMFPVGISEFGFKREFELPV